MDRSEGVRSAGSPARTFRTADASGGARGQRCPRYQLIRNDAVGYGERTPLACGFRRPAGNLATPFSSHQTVRLQMVARSRGRDGHDGTRDACAPQRTASFRLMECPVAPGEFLLASPDAAP